MGHAIDEDGRPVFDYLNPDLPPGLKLVDVPLVDATDESLAGFGEIVRDPYAHRVEIVPWPVRGRRKLDSGTGDQAGAAEGVFACEWRDGRLYGRNEAVDGHYVIGFRDPPELEDRMAERSGGRVLLWHVNYHPDGGQLFWPLDGEPFVVPVAPPGEDPDLARFVAFRSDGSFGIYIRPEIWHEGVFPVGESGRYFDRQGRVHARISCDLAGEYGVLLNVPLIG